MTNKKKWIVYYMYNAKSKKVAYVNMVIIQYNGKYLAVSCLFPAFTCGFTCLTSEDNVWRFAFARRKMWQLITYWTSLTCWVTVFTVIDIIVLPLVIRSGHEIVRV